MATLIGTRPELIIADDIGTENEAAAGNYSSALGKAIALWRSGRNISFTLGTELREQGYDVAALAAAHRT